MILEHDAKSLEGRGYGESGLGWSSRRGVRRFKIWGDKEQLNQSMGRLEKEENEYNRKEGGPQDR